MASEVDTRIVEGLFEQLRSLSPSCEIRKPNVFGDPPKDSNGNVVPYLALSFMPAKTTGYSVLNSGSNIHRGIFQVSVFWPRNEGLPPALELAGSIARTFKKGTKIFREGVRINVVSPPTVETPRDEDKLLHVPVSIPYFVTTPNE